MKKCPICGYENPDDAGYCEECGAEFPKQVSQQTPSDAPPKQVSQQTPSDAPPKQVSQQTPPPPGGQRCSNCGIINPLNARYCVECGAPLIEASTEGEKEKIIAKLVLQNAQYSEILINHEEQKIGREDFIGILPPDLGKLISRKNKQDNLDSCQFKIFQKDNKLYIRDDYSTNGTWVNGKNIARKGDIEIRDGDEVIIADNQSLRMLVKII